MGDLFIELFICGLHMLSDWSCWVSLFSELQAMKNIIEKLLAQLLYCAGFKIIFLFTKHA